MHGHSIKGQRSVYHEATQDNENQPAGKQLTSLQPNIRAFSCLSWLIIQDWTMLQVDNAASPTPPQDFQHTQSCGTITRG